MYQYLKESWWDGWRRTGDKEVAYIWEIIYNLTDGRKDLPEEEEGEQVGKKKSIQSQESPLMDEEDTLIDEKALSPVASWLTSSLLACSTVERFRVTDYGIHNSEPADAD